MKLIPRRVQKYQFGGSPFKIFSPLFQKATDFAVNNPIQSFGLYNPEEHRANDTEILVSGEDENGYPTIGTTQKYALNLTQPPLLGSPQNTTKLMKLAQKLRKFNSFQPARFLWNVPETATDAAAIMGHGEGYFLNGNNAYILSRSPQSGEPFLARIPKKAFELYKPAMDERGFINMNELENASGTGLYEALSSRFPTTIAGRKSSNTFIDRRKIAQQLGMAENQPIIDLLQNAKFIYKNGDSYSIAIQNGDNMQLVNIKSSLSDKLLKSNIKIPIIDSSYSKTSSIGRIPYTPDSDKFLDRRIIADNPYDVDELPIYLQPSTQYPATYKSKQAFDFDVENLNGPVIKVPKTQPQPVEAPILQPKKIKIKYGKDGKPIIRRDTKGILYYETENGGLIKTSNFDNNMPRQTLIGRPNTHKANRQAYEYEQNEKRANIDYRHLTAGRLAPDEKPLAVFYELEKRHPSNQLIVQLRKRILSMTKKGKTSKEIDKFLSDNGITWRLKDISDEEFIKKFGK